MVIRVIRVFRIITLQRNFRSYSSNIRPVTYKRKMPPKKKEEEEATPLLGRFGTSLKCGIVGLPNVGYVPLMDDTKNHFNV